MNKSIKLAVIFAFAVLLVGISNEVNARRAPAKNIGGFVLQANADIVIPVIMIKSPATSTAVRKFQIILPAVDDLVRIED